MKLTIASENFVWPKCKFLLISRTEPLIKTSRPEKHIRLKEFSNLRSVKWLIACLTPCSLFMMTSSNGNIFRVTGPLCKEFTRHRWISLTKASDAKLWCFLWSAPESNREAGDWRRHRAHYDVIVIQIKICAEYRDMLPRPRLVCLEPGLRPIGRSPDVPDKSSRGVFSTRTKWMERL